MLVRCINVEEALAPRGLIGPVQPHPEYIHEWTVGRLYVVYGTGVFADNVQLLIQNDGGRPRWSDPHFFELVEGRVPAHWEFRYFVMDSQDPWQRRVFQAIWGYQELVRNAVEHNNGLADLEPEALEIFQRQVDTYGREALAARG